VKKNKRRERMEKCLIAVLLTIFMLFVAGCDDKKSSPADSENTDENTGDSDSNLDSDEDTAFPDEDDFNDSIFGEMVQNPSGNIPLSASVKIILKEAAKIKVYVADIKEGVAPFSREYAPSGDAEEYSVPVLGLFPDKKNLVAVMVFDTDNSLIGKKTFEITTEALPKDFPTVKMEGTIDSGWTIVNYLRTPRSRPEMSEIAIDELGRIRWYTDFPFSNAFPLTLKDNTFYTSDGENTLYKFDFMGYELGKWDITEHGFTKIHHEIFIKDDGNIILGVSKTDDSWIEDRMIEINPETNQLRGTWNLTKIFPDICDLHYDMPLSAADDPAGKTNNPIHHNAAWYQSDDDSIIVGSQTSGIAKITHSGYLKWFLAPHITAYIDDADNDGVSDSLVDGYNAADPTTMVGDFKGDKYTEDRMPIDGKPHEDYSQLDWRYPEFLLTPVDSEGKTITDNEILMGFANHKDFVWPSREHNPTILKNGNLLIFDNGLARNFTYPPVSQNHYSRAVEFEITSDETDGYGGTVKQVWEYIINEDPLWYGLGLIVGSASELENGNRLIVSGSIGSTFIPDLLRPFYGEGPIGALIIEVDPKTNTEANRMFLKRYIDDTDYPNTEFSAYRANRFELIGVLK